MPYKIIKKRELAPHIKLIEVDDEEIAKKSRPGHFVILLVDEAGERIPITIAGADPERGSITLVFKEVGRSTMKLGALEEGDEILHLVGPLGNPVEAERYGEILCVGGEVFIPALHYEAQALKEAGNKITSIIGARRREHLIYVEEMRKVSDGLYIATDDGSAGYRGLGFLEELLERRRFDHVFTIGPINMQREISEMTRPYGIPTTVHLFPIMVDGTGMCGACRVTVGGETKFTCVDGPAFDGHQVDFQELINRMMFYRPHEKISLIMAEAGGDG